MGCGDVGVEGYGGGGMDGRMWDVGMWGWRGCGGGGMWRWRDVGVEEEY